MRIESTSTLPRYLRRGEHHNLLTRLLDRLHRVEERERPRSRLAHGSPAVALHQDPRALRGSMKSAVPSHEPNHCVRCVCGQPGGGEAPCTPPGPVVKGQARPTPECSEQDCESDCDRHRRSECREPIEGSSHQHVTRHRCYSIPLCPLAATGTFRTSRGGECRRPSRLAPVVVPVPIARSSSRQEFVPQISDNRRRDGDV